MDLVERWMARADGSGIRLVGESRSSGCPFSQLVTEGPGHWPSPDTTGSARVQYWLGQQTGTFMCNCSGSEVAADGSRPLVHHFLEWSIVVGV